MRKSRKSNETGCLIKTTLETTTGVVTIADRDIIIDKVEIIREAEVIIDILATMDSITAEKEIIVLKAEIIKQEVINIETQHSIIDVIGVVIEAKMIDMKVEEDIMMADSLKAEGMVNQVDHNRAIDPDSETVIR